MGIQPNTPLARRRSTARRGLLATMVVGCLLLFTAYATEGDGGPLHGLQSTAGAIIAPLQDGTSRAVRPLRDAWGWSTSLIDARNRAADLEQQVADLKTELARVQFDREEADRVAAAKGVGDAWRKDYTPVRADIIGSPPSPWSHRAVINRGTTSGVRVNSPVMAMGDAEGLVGLVTEAHANSATVTFLTEARTTVGVLIVQADSARGLLSPSTPGQLQITNIPIQKPVRRGQLVETAGYSALRTPSVFPRGLPVGQVLDAGGRDTDVVQRVQVFPFVNPDDLAFVTVLAPTSPEALRRAQETP